MMHDVQDMINTNKLIADFSTGDIEAHNFFFRMHFEELCRFTEMLTGNLEDGVKLVQESIVRVWYRDNTALRSLSDIKTLLFLTVKYACTEYLTNKGNESYVLYRARIRQYIDAIVESVTLENMDHATINKARAVLKLAFANALPVEAIAKKLQQSVEEVSHNLHIAREAIRFILIENS